MSIYFDPSYYDFICVILFQEVRVVNGTEIFTINVIKNSLAKFSCIEIFGPN